MQLKRLTAGLVFLATAVLVFSQTGFKPTWAKPKGVSADALQGAWIITEIGGEKTPPGEQPITVLFVETEYFIKRGEETLEAGQFFLSPGGATTLVDFRIRTGDNARKSQLGLIAMSGDELRWCMGEAGSMHRPGTFANLAGSHDSAQSIVVAVRAGAKTAQRQSIASPSAALEGRWKITSVDGRVPSEEFAHDFVTFTGSHFTWEFRKGRLSGSMHLNTHSNPMEIDLQSETDKDEVYKGIFEIGDTELRLHLIEGKTATRPKDFSDVNCAAYMLTRTGAEVRAAIESHASVTPAAPAAALAITSGGIPLSSSRETTIQGISLQGTWTVTSVGGRSRDTSARPMTFVFEGQEFRMEDGGMVMLAGQWKLGADRNPMTIDISLIGADRQPTGDQIQGLIEVNSTTLRLAMGDPNTPRPKTFNSSKDTDGIDSSLMIAEKSAPGKLQDARKARAQMPVATERTPSLLDAIQGKWLAKESGGGPIPDGPYITTYDGEMWSVNSPKHSAKGHFRINDSTKPAQIDVFTDWGSWTNNPIGVVHGILELDGTTLRICTGNPGADFRPTAFENARPRGSIPGNDSTLAIYVRDGAASKALTSASSLQGTWTVTSVGGRSRDPSQQSMTFVFEGQEFRMEDGGMVMLAGQWKLDADRNPMTIDISLIGGDRQPTGDVIQGLVEVNGTTLRLAMGDPNTPRPKSFNSSKETDGIDSSLMIAVKR